MPIEVKKDIARKYGLEEKKSFWLKDGINDYLVSKNDGRFKSGSLIGKVRDAIAEQNWDDFWHSWKVNFIDGAKRQSNIFIPLAKKFNLDDNKEAEETFEKLYTIFFAAQTYEKKDATQDQIADDLKDAYKYIAQIANGSSIDKYTFSRVEEKKDQNNFVIFSDFHRTSYDNLKELNYDLYLKVLQYYLVKDFCLVENGDTEDCLIYEPTLDDAKDRETQSKGLDFPIEDSGIWSGFLDIRYKQRFNNLTKIVAKYNEYFESVRKFILKEKYVKIAGNHDTYLGLDREIKLRDYIEDQLNDGVPEKIKIGIRDILRIYRSEKVKYVVTHGHQFDTVCLLHGNRLFAHSLGEVYTECASWAFQGADRRWTDSDTKKWYNGNTFQNCLSKEEPRNYSAGNGGQTDLALNNKTDIKSDSKGFLETILGHEIAWEYFENSDAFNAFALEVWMGDEFYKMRHLNEIDLCYNYEREFKKLKPNKVVPKLIIGHTHEPRQNSEMNKFSIENGFQKSYPDYYLNSGSAGRYENLIWCVEINWNGSDYEDVICSWSLINERLRKTVWNSTDKPGWLIHARYEYG